MIKSMTGFGRKSASIKGKKITVEVRSVNSKGLDTGFRLPSLYREKENDLRTLIGERLKRGKIDLSISVEAPEGDSQVRLNKQAIRAHYKELKAISRELKLDEEEMLLALLRMPDVFQNNREELNDHEWKPVRKAVEEALKALDRFRTSEGNNLEKDLRSRIALIGSLLGKVEQLDKARIPALREKIRKQVDELAAKVDQNRFEQEIIYYSEKLDITEEKVRLRSHNDYFLKTMGEDDCGRKLAFISQEIGREINTIGSKANDAEIQKLVVQMKDELEKIKEQLNNIL